MLARYIFSLLVLMLFSYVISINHNKPWTDDYNGVIGDNSKIRMSIKVQGNDVSGVYFYESDLKDIQVKGKIDGRKIILKEMDGYGKVAAFFRGRFLKHSPEFSDELIKFEVIEGEWFNLNGSLHKKFRLVIDDSTGTQSKNRYSVAGFDNDQDVETIARELKRAVIGNDKEKVASLIDYPINITLKEKVTEIENKDDFIKNYDDIFKESFLKNLKDSVPHNMFANSEGVMLGPHGEIWIGSRGNQARIIAINNGSTN